MQQELSQPLAPSRPEMQMAPDTGRDRTGRGALHWYLHTCQRCNENKSKPKVFI